MKYALFLGCTVPVRGRNYELSSRKIAEKLGIEFVDINDFSCCGFPIKGIEYDYTQMMCARNLALAEEQGLDICVLCSACTAMLTEANHELQTHPELLAEANKHLKKIGREYKGTVKIKHFSRILYEDIGLEEIQKHVKVSMDQFKFAPHYGCHYLKPSEVIGEFDNVETPSSIAELLEAAGTGAARLGNKKHCCGGAVLAVNQEITYKMARKKLDAVKEDGADAMCVICPFCAVIYDDNQKAIGADIEMKYDIPVLYYPQILGLAMGMDSKELGMKMNKVKTKELLARMAEETEG